MGTAGAANCHGDVRRVHAKNTVMVRLDITVENRSPLSFTIQNRADNAKAAIGAGIFRSGVPAMAMRTLQLMPQVDAYGIERGIVGPLSFIVWIVFARRVGSSSPSNTTSQLTSAHTLSTQATRACSRGSPTLASLQRMTPLRGRVRTGFCLRLTSARKQIHVSI